MKSKFTLKSLKIIAGSFILLFAFTAGAQTYDKDYQDGRLYFKYKDNVEVNIPVNADRSVDLDKAPILNSLKSDFNIEAVSRPYDFANDPKLLKTFMIEFEPYEDIEEIMAELQLNNELEYVERVPYKTINYQPNDSLYNLVNGPANWNWHWDLINAEGAWDLSQGSADINVAVVDNAVWVDHPDLTDKVVAQRDTYYNNGNANPPGSGDPGAWSHGTHVSGLSAGSSDNGIGIASIGFNVSLIAVKAANNSNPNGIYGYPGIQWAANNGADIINMSWGGGGYSQTEQNIVTSIYNQGIILFAAAGNDNNAANHYPSSYDNVISVASVDYNDIKSSFSSYNTTVDISAPGGSNSPGPSGLLSTYYSEETMGYYDAIYGTSMASPVAAGLGALILSVNPDLTPDQVEEILEETSVDIDAINPDYAGMLGAGRIDAYQAILNTPFEPTADFMTPVTTIKPGHVVDFTSMSTGVPDSYAWVFEGAATSSSSDENPTGIEYLTEGTWDVSLTVTNEFGTDVLLMEDYITVTWDPAPWVVFSSDDSSTCVFDAVTFSDLTLYNPTEWLWEFDPATVSFLDGTDETSQNPVVQFEKEGWYSVSLTATNENGTSENTLENMIYAQGLELNFTEDFETGETGNFTLMANEKANISIDKRASNNESTYGLHFQGNTEIGGWTGNPGSTTPEQAWEENTEFHSMASNCNVDATGVNAVALSLDLRQTYSIANKGSWFRVLINDEPVSDFTGTENFNPETNEDPFVTRVFNLSEYANGYFDIKFQAACYLSDRFFQEGDNAFVDNIAIYNSVGTEENLSNNAGMILYPVPANEFVNVSVAGFENDYSIAIFNTMGQLVHQQENISAFNNHLNTLNISNLNNGVYMIKAFNENEEVVKRLIIQ